LGWFLLKPPQPDIGHCIFRPSNLPAHWWHSPPLVFSIVCPSSLLLPLMTMAVPVPQRISRSNVDAVVGGQNTQTHTKRNRLQHACTYTRWRFLLLTLMLSQQTCGSIAKYRIFPFFHFYFFPKGKMHLYIFCFLIQDFMHLRTVFWCVLICFNAFNVFWWFWICLMCFDVMFVSTLSHIDGRWVVNALGRWPPYTINFGVERRTTSHELQEESLRDHMWCGGRVWVVCVCVCVFFFVCFCLFFSISSFDIILNFVLFG